MLAVGRYNGEFDFTEDAWQKASPVENPNAFLRVYDADFDCVQHPTSGSGSLRDRQSGQGSLPGSGRAEKGLTVSKDSAGGGPHGKSDGYLMVLRFKGDQR